MYSNIVVGTDGSATAKKALGHAMDLAAVNGGTCAHRQRLSVERRSRQGRHRGRALVRRYVNEDRHDPRQRCGGGPQQGPPGRDPRRGERSRRCDRGHRRRSRRRRRRRRQQGHARAEALPARQRAEQGRPPRPVHRGHRQDDAETERGPQCARTSRSGHASSPSAWWPRVFAADGAGRAGDRCVWPPGAERERSRSDASSSSPGTDNATRAGNGRPRQQRSLDPPCQSPGR